MTAEMFAIDPRGDALAGVQYRSTLPTKLQEADA